MLFYILYFYQHKVAKTERFSKKENKRKSLCSLFSAAVNEYLLEQACDKEGFQEALEPINDFPV